MVLQDGFTDLYSDKMSEMPTTHHHCPCFHVVPQTKTGDFGLCNGNCGYPSSCHGCCTHCSFLGPSSYPQSSPPCNSYDGHPSEIYSMESPEYIYKEYVPRNYEWSELSNDGTNVDVEEVNFGVDEKNDEVKNYEWSELSNDGTNVDVEEVNFEVDEKNDEVKNYSYPDMLFPNGLAKDIVYEVAAVVLQSAYRGYAVRKLDLLNKMRKIADVREQAADVGDCIQFLCSAFNPEVGKEQSLILEEKIMSLLLQLDSLEVLSTNIRETRKSVARELTGLLEKLDCWAAGASEKCHKEVSTDEHVDRNNDKSEGEEENEPKQLETSDNFSEYRNEPSEIPSREKESDAKRPVKLVESSCRFMKHNTPVKPESIPMMSLCRLTESEERLVVSSMEPTYLAALETQSGNLIKENEELRKLVKEHSSVVSRLNRIVDVLEEKLGAEKKPLRGKQARDRCQYAREEDEIYDEIDEQGYNNDQYDQFDQNVEDVMELVFLVLFGLVVWGIVWFR